MDIEAAEQLKAQALVKLVDSNFFLALVTERGDAEGQNMFYEQGQRAVNDFIGALRKEAHGTTEEIDKFLDRPYPGYKPGVEITAISLAHMAQKTAAKMSDCLDRPEGVQALKDKLAEVVVLNGYPEDECTRLGNIVETRAGQIAKERSAQPEIVNLAHDGHAQNAVGISAQIKR